MNVNNILKLYTSAKTNTVDNLQFSWPNNYVVVVVIIIIIIIILQHVSIRLFTKSYMFFYLGLVLEN